MHELLIFVPVAYVVLVIWIGYSLSGPRNYSKRDHR